MLQLFKMPLDSCFILLLWMPIRLELRGDGKAMQVTLLLEMIEPPELQLAFVTYSKGMHLIKYIPMLLN